MARSLGLFCQRLVPTNRDNDLRKNLAALLDILDLVISESDPPLPTHISTRDWPNNFVIQVNVNMVQRLALGPVGSTPNNRGKPFKSVITCSG